MLKWLDKIKTAVFIAFCILFVFQTDYAKSETEVAYEIADIAVALSGDAISYTLLGNSPPVYNVTERFAPFRVLVDVAGAFYGNNLAPEKTKLPENKFATLKISDIKDQLPAHMRFEFSITDSHDYSVEKAGNNLIVKFFPATAKKSAPMAASLPGKKSLDEFKVVSTPNTTTITILSNGLIENYTVDTIGSGAKKPPRMFIDIDDVAINALLPVFFKVKYNLLNPSPLMCISSYPTGKLVIFKYSLSTSGA